MMDKVVATIGNTALVQEPEGEELKQEVSLYERRAMSVTVSNDAENAEAGKMLRDVKQMQKQVKAYWEPIVKQAYEHHKALKAKENEMTTPLNAAEKILKTKMGDYADEQRRKKQAEQEALRRLAQEEMDRKLAEAANAEAKGDSDAALYAMAEAEVLDGASRMPIPKTEAPKADGISQTVSWRITGIDSAQVPVTFGGVEIRPVDEKAVLRIIKQAKGAVQIPGIQFEEYTSISARS